jgi:hypothetical protein
MEGLASCGLFLLVSFQSDVFSRLHYDMYDEMTQYHGWNGMEWGVCLLFFQITGVNLQAFSYIGHQK